MITKSKCRKKSNIHYRKKSIKRKTVRRRQVGSGWCEDTYKIKRSLSSKQKLNLLRVVHYALCKYIFARKLHKQYFGPYTPAPRTIPDASQSLSSRSSSGPQSIPGAFQPVKSQQRSPNSKAANNLPVFQSPKKSPRKVSPSHVKTKGTTLSLFTSSETQELQNMNLPERPLNAHSTKGDGNCFYNAMAMLIASRETNQIPKANDRNIKTAATQLRNENSRFMQQQPDFDLEHEGHDVSKDGRWAGQQEITALSTFLNTPIHVYSKTGHDAHMAGSYGETISGQAPFTIWYSNNHFEAIAALPKAR